MSSWKPYSKALPYLKIEGAHIIIIIDCFHMFILISVLAIFLLLYQIKSIYTCHVHPVYRHFAHSSTLFLKIPSLLSFLSKERSRKVYFLSHLSHYPPPPSLQAKNIVQTELLKLI